LPLLCVAAALALGWGLSGWRLLDPDEGRNAEVAREMALSHDYLVPHLDGLPYLDKPVVYFAAAALAMTALGPSEAAARLPAYLSTLATLVLLVGFARRRWGRDAGWLAGLAFVTMPLVLAYARETIFDATLTFFITAAILALVEERPALAWAAMGLGAITKGPIALLLPLLAVVPWAIATGRSWRRLVSLPALGAFAVTALPWFVAVSLVHPDFPHYVFVRETLQRVTTRTFHRTAPFWYYLPIMLVGPFPWVVPALARWRRWRAAWAARRSDPAASDAVLLASWALVPLVFLSLNQSKLPHYVLPLMPAVALAAARALADAATTAWRWAAGALAAMGILLLTLTRWMPAPLSLTPAEKAAIPPTVLVLGIVLLAAAALVASGARWGRPDLAAAGYAACVLAIPFAGARLLAAVGDDRSSAAIVQATIGALAGGGNVIGVAAYPPSLPFYMRQLVPVATATGRELTSNYIADQQETFRALPGSPLLPADAWRDALARCATRTVFITRRGDAAARATLGATLPLLAEDARYAAYGPCRPSKPPQPSEPPGPPQRGGRVR
jgi:4-amino-4-deoxy-L-arabinose transferase-like glycosyltransferase